MKLNIKAFTLASGITWGINWFLVTWWMMALEGISREITFVGKMYPGYSISPVGSLFGLFWGFLDGCLLGFMVSWIYNKLIPRFRSQEE